MLKDIGMTMPKSIHRNTVYTDKNSDDDMKNTEQHEGKGRG